MRSKWDWIGALTGVLAIVVGFIGILIAGEPPGADEGSAKVIEWYTDNKDEVQISAVLGVVAATLLVFFFGYLRRVLRQAEGEGGTLSIVALVGAAALAIGIAFDTTLSFAIAEAVDNKLDPTAILAMQAIWDNDFLMFMLGVVLIHFSVGISVLRHRGLPLWLGIVSIILGLVSVTPIGFIGALGLLAWILVVSVLLTIRAAKAGSAPAATTTV